MVAAAVAAFAVPAAAPVMASAQDAAAEMGQDGRVRGGGRGDRPERGQRAPDSGAEAQSERQQAPERPRRPDASSDHSAGGGGRGADRQTQPDRPQRPDRDPGNSGGQNGGGNGQGGRPDRDPSSNGGQNRPDRGGQTGGWTGQGGRPDRDHDNNGRNRPDRDGRNGGWNGDRGGRDHGRDQREFHSRFNGDQWRRDWNRRHGDDWWRGDRRFRGFTGVRFGFYFAPGYGYYNVPRSYFGQRWYPGDYLPSIFWRYSLSDWQTFGLGYPPPGTRWVWVDNSIYLIDDMDGYIIDVVYDAWRW